MGLGGFGGAPGGPGRFGGFLGTRRGTRRWSRNEPPISNVRSCQRPTLSIPATLIDTPLQRISGSLDARNRSLIESCLGSHRYLCLFQFLHHVDRPAGTFFRAEAAAFAVVIMIANRLPASNLMTALSGQTV